ncbi:MAG TPA: ABC transporter substrate-binding protein [Stellaceae bacterium]|nr:ABC transporter substrate-binding protein [Stellaceae bacterium]
MRQWMIVAVLLAGIGLARADEPQSAAAFVDSLVSDALVVIKDGNLSDGDRQARFEALLQRGFDMPRIARYVLGRYWNSASDNDRQAFAQLFQRWVVQIYAMRFKGYSGEQVKVIGARDEGQGALVTTEIASPSSGAPPVKVDWRVGHQDGAYHVLDIDVEGVSMALTEREEIASVIQRSGGTVASLNRTFAERLGMAGTADAEH